MRAFLIDPFEQSVREVAHEGDFHDILNQIRSKNMDAATLGVSGGVKITVYVADDGYYVQPQAWWRFDGNPNPLPGRGLIVGTDYKGDTVAAPVDELWIKQRVDWLGSERPKLPDIEVQTARGVKRIAMNGPNAPKSAEEAALLIAEAQGDKAFADFIRSRQQPEQPREP